MTRHFNTAGPCDAARHYLLPPERRLPEVERLLVERQYFVLHAPRQVGKTTSFRALAQRLTASGRFAALHTSCETGSSLHPDVAGNLAAVADSLRQSAEINLPEELRPPEIDASRPIKSQFGDLLQRWAELCPRPILLFLDEIDALFDDTLISVLRQLRAGFPARPDGFPQSVVLIGLRDVRDYKLEAEAESESLGTASPFNIKVESLTLRNFVQEEIAELYAQHEAEKGQAFLPAAISRAFELTGGQPWLVNALARQAVEVLVPDRSRPIGREDIEKAADILIDRRDTHLDSLIDRLREPRVQRVLAPILAGELVLGERIDDDVAYVEDLGLVKSDQGHLEIANEIYREVIPRALAAVTQRTIYHETAWYLRADGSLDLNKLLHGFVDFWREHGEAMLASQPYHEVAAQLVLMSFLQRIINGGGRISREYAVGRGRLDLSITWPGGSKLQREALELKTWRDGQADPAKKGLDQITAYLERLSLDEGTLVIFDQRKSAPPVAERGSFEAIEHRGARITLLRL